MHTALDNAPRPVPPEDAEVLPTIPADGRVSIFLDLSNPRAPVSGSLFSASQMKASPFRG